MGMGLRSWSFGLSSYQKTGRIHPWHSISHLSLSNFRLSHLFLTRLNSSEDC